MSLIIIMFFLEYPMSLSSEQLDDVMAPYLSGMVVRNERFRNKKLLRKQKQGGKTFKGSKREKKYIETHGHRLQADDGW